MVRCMLAIILALATLEKALALAEACAVVTVTPDGMLSLRSGPGASFPEIMLLRSGQFVSLDDLHGDPEGRWWHVTGLMEGKARGGLRSTRHVEGWANSRYLHPINCD
jgi:hypothetical protein